MHLTCNEGIGGSIPSQGTNNQSVTQSDIFVKVFYILSDLTQNIFKDLCDGIKSS
jgi:hypothetical protein